MKHVSKFIKEIEKSIQTQLCLIEKESSDRIDCQQVHQDNILEVYREAFSLVIQHAKTYSDILQRIKLAYENSILIRNKRISYFITQDRIYGISKRKEEHNEKQNRLLEENEMLQRELEKYKMDNDAMQKQITKLEDEITESNAQLAKERITKSVLLEEKQTLETSLKQLNGSSYKVDDDLGDPVLLRIALDRCRQVLSSTQSKLREMTDDYAETVPTRQYEILETKFYELTKQFDTLNQDFEILNQKYAKLQATRKSLDMELNDVKDRCSDLERAGTPRPHWEMCADFIGGGKDRWRQLAQGLTSREILKVLLKELGPAAETEQLEHLDGLGTDPRLPQYLWYEGRVRNLRLSRREISVMINDIWMSKAENGMSMSMQDYVTKYFEDRYQHPSVRAEWAYNLCSGAEQMFDDPQVKLFWAVLQGHLSEDIYWGIRREWLALKENLYRLSKDDEVVTIDDFEKAAKKVFPLKSEVDIKNLIDAVKRQLKLKLGCNDISLDKLFEENEEGYDRVELARELYRQRQIAQDKYIRGIVAELGGKNATNKLVTVENLKRAFAIVDPAIDHKKMEKNIRWAFSEATSDLNNITSIPLRVLMIRLAAGDIERVGPRGKQSKRRVVSRH